MYRQLLSRTVTVHLLLNQAPMRRLIKRTVTTTTTTTWTISWQADTEVGDAAVDRRPQEADHVLTPRSKRFWRWRYRPRRRSR